MPVTMKVMMMRWQWKWRQCLCQWKLWQCNHNGNDDDDNENDDANENDVANDNESDGNSMLWVHLSPKAPPRALSHLNSEKSEQCAPLFASDHISHLNLDHISYLRLDDVPHLNSEDISYLNLTNINLFLWFFVRTHTHTHAHIGQFPQDGDYGQNVTFFWRKKVEPFVRPNPIIFFWFFNCFCPLHHKNTFIWKIIRI